VYTVLKYLNNFRVHLSHDLPCEAYAESGVAQMDWMVIRFANTGSNIAAATCRHDILVAHERPDG